MNSIFVYGTLLNNEILERLLGFLPIKSDAILYSYKRLQILGEVYPAIRPSKEDYVEGAVLSDLSKEHMLILDEYESIEYERESVAVQLPNGERTYCDTYVYKPEYYWQLSEKPWSNNEFRKKHLKEYLNYL